MSKARLSIFVSIVMLFSVSTFAVDGIVLLNQASVMTAGGFPYVISQSGSYRLSGNLTVPSGVDGIDITADNVTLDLNGFAIIGPVTCDGAPASTTTTCTGNAGEGVSSTANNVTVRNGTIRGMFVGLDLEGSGSLIEEVHAFNNSLYGMFVEVCVVRRSTATNNGRFGIFAEDAVVTENLVLGNKKSGLIATGATVSHNTASSNGDNGIRAASSKVTDNTATFNAGFGLLITDGLYGSNLLLGNTAGSASADSTSISQNNNNCAGSVC